MVTTSRVLFIGSIVASAIAMSACASSDSETSEDVDVTVTSGKAAPVKRTVTLRFDGETYSCPLATADKLDPLKGPLAERKLKYRAAVRKARRAEREIERLDKRYPGHSAPTQEIADEYNALLSKVRRLDSRAHSKVDDFNSSVDEYNSVLKAECT